MTAEGPTRESAFGERRRLNSLDRLNTWVSGLAVRRGARLEGARFADFGCGYEARFAGSILDRVKSATLVDLAIAGDVKRDPKVTALEGPIEEVAKTIPDASFDTIVCLSVLEHLNHRQEALNEFRRMLAPGGRLLINVPSWVGKPVLELMAFRLGVSPREEIDDHRIYYNPRDLWPLLVDAGFLPATFGAAGTSSACAPSPSARRPRARRSRRGSRGAPRSHGPSPARPSRPRAGAGCGRSRRGPPRGRRGGGERDPTRSTSSPPGPG